MYTGNDLKGLEYAAKWAGFILFVIVFSLGWVCHKYSGVYKVTIDRVAASQRAEQ